MKSFLIMLGRIFLITFGLFCIASGGFCALLTIDAGPSGGFMPLLSLTTLGVGLAIVIQTVRRWQGRTAGGDAGGAASKQSASNKENQ